MLKSKLITIDSGRDKDKTYVITEMPAAKIDNWAMRALIAVAGSAVSADAMLDAASRINEQDGLIGMINMTFDALGSINPNISIPLLDELLQCVEIRLEGGKCRPLDPTLNDIQDFRTYWRLRKEVFALHMDF